MPSQNFRTILHVDLNSFFASVEQQLNPYLRHQPVGVLKAKGRSCIIACSNEAKRFGLKTGINLFEARKLCPQLILVPAQFHQYAKVTQQFIKLTQNYSDVVEVFSLDEVFLDITHTAHLFGGPLLLAYDLQQAVSDQLGEYIGCSIGIAENKLLAKMASGMAQKKSVFVVTSKNKTSLLATAPFEEVCGIGYRLTKRLKNLGITCLPQILTTPQNLLLKAFGRRWSKQLQAIAQGQDNSPLITTNQLSHAKSVSRTYTLYHDTTDQKTVKALIRNLVEEACFKLRQMRLVGRQFGLSVRGQHQSAFDYLTTKTLTDSGVDIFNIIYRLYQNLHWQHPVRFVGVWVNLLSPQTALPLPLFSQQQKADTINQTIDTINLKFGPHTVCPASMLNHHIIRPELNGFLGDKHYTLKTSWQL